LELAVEASRRGQPATKQLVQEASQKTLLYDKGGALHKSLGNSDVNSGWKRLKNGSGRLTGVDKERPAVTQLILARSSFVTP